MEHFVQMLDMVCTDNVYGESTGICFRPMTICFCILSACESILARYFEAFLWISHFSFLIFNESFKFTEAQSITEEQTIAATVGQIMHKTLGKIIC